MPRRADHTSRFRGDATAHAAAAALLLLTLGAASAAPPTTDPRAAAQPATAASTAPRPDSVIARPSLVAFVLPDGRPAVIDASTADVTPIAATRQRSAFPAWSPDGERIAYIALAGAAARVDVVDAAGAAEPVSVYASPSDPPIYLSWSPAGDRLAVLAADAQGLALHLAGLDPESSRLLARGSPFFWSWSRAGDRLLVHRDVLREEALLGFTGLDAFHVAEPFPDPGAFGSPALSPSERFVAYATLLGGDVRRVVVASLPGGPGSTAEEGVRRELPHLGQASLVWHPTRDLLAIQRADARTFGSVSLLDAATGDLEVVVPGRSLAFFWSPDGESIAYLTLALGGMVDPEQRVSEALFVQEPRLPRLALRVLDVATGHSRELATFVPTRLFVEQYLPFFDQYARSHRVWSPASDALVFTAVDAAGVPTITVFGLDGSVTPLTPGEMPSWNVR